MKKRLISFIVVFIFSFSLIGCRKDEKLSKRDTYMLGTIISLKYYGENGEKAIEESLDKLKDIENKMSLNIDSSEICKLNKNAGKTYTKVSKDTYEVINEALEYGELSKGAFDISILPVSSLWNIGTDNPRVPESEEIKNALKYVNYKNIVLNKKDNSVFLKEGNMAIDLGGIAKGYAADQLKSIVEKYKIKRAFINLGGNLYVYGEKEKGEPWNIGIQDPLGDKGKSFATLRVKNKSVVTSGNYERYFIKNGKRYHHIFDPKTGYPAERGIISSTIISDKSMDGDALSTATYVLGVDEAMKLINSLKGVEAVFVTADKKVYTTEGIKDSLEITNGEFTYEKGR